MSAHRIAPSRWLALAAPLALAVSACSGDADAEGDGLDGDPIADIAAPDGTSWLDTVTVTEDGGYKVGNPDAPIKLVEYASHTCGACASFAQQSKETLKSKYVASGVVSFEQRELIRNFQDLVIATMVQCGPKESMQPLSDVAWQEFDSVMNAFNANGAAIQAAGELPNDQKFVAAAEAAGLPEFFASRGLSADQAKACLADTDKIQKIAETSDEQTQKYSISGTPTFMINGKRVDAGGWADLEPILQSAGARDAE